MATTTANDVTMKNTFVSNKKNRFAFVFVVMVGGAGSAVADGWEIEPSVTVATTYSDNIDLEENGESDLVLEVSPGISFSREGRRLNVDLDYSLQNLVYQDNSDLDTSNHRLSTNANAELLADTLFLDVRGSMSQQLSDRTASSSSDGISGAANLSDVTTYSISPYWQQRVGDLAAFELRYTFDRVTSDDSVGSGDDSDSNGVSFDIQNGSATGRINWAISHDTEEIRYDDGGKSDRETTSAQLGYQLTRSFNVFVSRTEEDNEFSGNRGDSEPEDSTTGAGLTWTPTEEFNFTAAYNKRLDPRPGEDERFYSGNLFWAPTTRTDINLGYGSRFFGKTYNANINHRTRWTRWTLMYDEGVSDFRTQAQGVGLLACPPDATSPAFCRVLGPGETRGPGEVFATLDGSSLLTGIRTDISNDTFINETASASVSIVGARNTITLSLTDSERTFVADNLVETDSSVDLSWTYELAPRTNSRVTLGHTKEEFDTGEEDDFMSYSWRITREVDESSVFFVEAQVSERDSADSSRHYDENRLTVSFQKLF